MVMPAAPFFVGVRAGNVFMLEARELRVAEEEREAKRHDGNDDDAAEELGEGEPPPQQRPKENENRKIHIGR